MKENFKELTNKVEEARSRLGQAIHNLPSSAGGIEMLGKNCGVVPFSKIASSGLKLNPRYYITMETKRVLMEKLNSSRSIQVP